MTRVRLLTGAKSCLESIRSWCRVACNVRRLTSEVGHSRPCRASSNSSNVGYAAESRSKFGALAAQRAMPVDGTAVDGGGSRNRVRLKRNLMRRFKLIWVVQSPCQKYCACAVGQISGTDSGRPASIRGALRDRHERWMGMRWTCWRVRRTLLARTAKPCGPDAPTLASSS